MDFVQVGKPFTPGRGDDQEVVEQARQYAACLVTAMTGGGLRPRVNNQAVAALCEMVNQIQAAYAALIENPASE